MQMINKHIRIFSASLIIMEIQIKITMKYCFIPNCMSIIKNTGTNENWQGYGEIRSITHCCWGAKMMQLQWKTFWQFLQALKIKMPYGPTISFPGMCRRALITSVNTNTCKRMFIVALLTIVKQQKQPKCPSTD